MTMLTPEASRSQKSIEMMYTIITRWISTHLFSSVFSGFLTLFFSTIGFWLLYQFVSFAIIDAAWRGGDKACSEAAGACWPFIIAKLDYLRYGSYPIDGRWRVDVTLFVGAVLIFWLLIPNGWKRGYAVAIFFLIYPIMAYFLLRGSPLLGLDIIDTGLWGGMLITLLMSTVGIVFSLPLGIVLALGRTSRLPIVKSVCVLYIEVVRGVPFITVLFMVNFMFPLFMPAALTPDRLLRPLVGISLFSAAYMAEVVRAGLNSLPRGQFEASSALGLSYAQTLRLVILPQALTVVIPSIVSTYIGLFKDTTLVAIVGIVDFLRAVENARVDPNWTGPTISPTGYLFAALVYWVFCFGMSRYSQSMERRLNRGHRTSH